MADHDESYKLLFSHPEMVRDLLVGFIHEPWVADIDFQTLEKVSGEYVSPELKENFSDTVYRVRFQNIYLYIYIILEFQSENEETMAARMLNYMGQFYLSLLRQKVAFNGKLPPVLPIVLYNGRSEWKAAREFADLVISVPQGIENYQPRMRYLLIEERALDESKSLAERNLVAALFRMEKCRKPEDIEEVVALLLEWFKDANQNELRDAFATWIRKVLLPARMPGATISESANLSLKEIKHMLAETVIEWTQQWKQEGLEKGRQEGLEKGLEKGHKKGMQKGRTLGEWIGKIELMEQFLGRTPTPKKELDEQSIEWMERYYREMETEYDQRFRK